MDNVKTNKFQRKMGRAQIHMSAYFLFVFTGFGVFFPLLGLYLEEVGLSGSQIGTIMSIGPIVAIITQPMWGMISDRFQNPKVVLTLSTLLTSLFGLGYLFYDQVTLSPFLFFAMIAASLSIFQSAIIPISDSIALSHVRREGGDYGLIRLWGAVGFAFAVWFAGTLIEYTSTAIIFYLFALALLISTFFASRLPGEADVPKVDLLSGLKQLVKIPSYVIFLFSTFLIFGAINSNNFYFGMYYTEIGGTVAGVGIVFLLSAGSEAPFMLFAKRAIKRFGIYQVLIFAGLLSGFRWLFFSIEPSVQWILAISILQGMAVGFYIPAAVQLVRDVTPDDVKVTGMSIYASFGNGLGTLACTFIGGYIIEYFSMAMMYRFFGFASLLGVSLLIVIMRLERKGRKEKSGEYKRRV